jgi:hypothetical protein
MALDPDTLMARLRDGLALRVALRIKGPRRKKSKHSKLATNRRRNAGRRDAARRKTARGRLSVDGATSAAAVRRRIRAIAYEWQLPPDDVAKALKSGNRATEEMFDFAERYHVSLDWLIWGDLKGLQQMTSERRARRFMTATRMEPGA